MSEPRMDASATDRRVTLPPPVGHRVGLAGDETNWSHTKRSTFGVDSFHDHAPRRGLLGAIPPGRSAGCRPNRRNISGRSRGGTQSALAAPRSPILAHRRFVSVQLAEMPEVPVPCAPGTAIAVALGGTRTTPYGRARHLGRGGGLLMGAPLSLRPEGRPGWGRCRRRSGCR